MGRSTHCFCQGQLETDTIFSVSITRRNRKRRSRDCRNGLRPGCQGLGNGKRTRLFRKKRGLSRVDNGGDLACDGACDGLVVGSHESISPGDATAIFSGVLFIGTLEKRVVGDEKVAVRYDPRAILGLVEFGVKVDGNDNSSCRCLSGKRTCWCCCRRDW